VGCGMSYAKMAERKPIELPCAWMVNEVGPAYRALDGRMVTLASPGKYA